MQRYVKLTRSERFFYGGDGHLREKVTNVVQVDQSCHMTFPQKA